MLLGGKAMKQLKWYGSLENSDVETFEKHLKQWAERNALNSSFVFDETSLNKISRMLKNQKNKNNPLNGLVQINASDRVKTMMTHDLILEWYAIGDEKCILKSIRTKDGETLYTEPKHWKDTALWYAF